MTIRSGMPRPPALAIRLLGWLLPETDREHIVGDLVEHFHSMAARDPASARRAFWHETMAAIWSLGLVRRRATIALPTTPTEPLIRQLWSDFRYTARSMRMAPVFTVLCAVTLGLGIGSAAAMFGIIERMILRGPDYIAAPRQVMRFYFTVRRPPGDIETGSVVGYAAYSALRHGTHDFTGFGAYQASTWVVGTGTEARSLPGVAASWDLFPTLGVHPYLGRFYSAAEDDPGAPRDVLVLSYEYWIRAFGGDRDILAKTLSVGFRPFTVIGIAPPGFTGTEMAPVDYWMPISAGSHPRPDWATTWQATWLKVVARLRPSVSTDQAARDATAAMRSAYTGRDSAWYNVAASARPLSFSSEGREPAVAAIARWLGAVTLVVLLIACANIGNLLLTRALRRRGEIAVRLALGMSRGRLVQWLLVEALALAALGGIVGVGVASAAGMLARRFFLSDVVWSSATVNPSIILAIIALTLGVALLVSLIPLLQSFRTDFVQAIKTGVRDGGGRQERLRSALLLGETALTGTLLVVAGLFVRSLMNVRQVDLGVQTDRVIAASVYWPLGTAADSAGRAAEAVRQRTTLERIRDSLAHRADIAGASLTIGSPFRTASSVDLKVPGWDSIPALAGGGPYIVAVGPDYFPTVGTRLELGRVFTPNEGQSAQRVAIVNETMARTLWPKRTPLGRCLLIGRLTQCATIVGVVHDVHRFDIEEPAAMQYYVPIGQEVGISGTTILARPRGAAPPVIDVVRQVVGGMVPGARYVDAALLQDRVDPQIRPWRLGAAMFGAFALLALIVAATGLYSVIAYLVAQRRREFGIRLAVGATSGRIVTLVVSYGIRIVLEGVIVATLAALALSSRIAPQLFQVSPRDPVVYGVVALVMMVVATLAMIAPAWHASTTDPAAALRQE